MSLDKYINLLTEEIIGNLAVVYHRGDENKLNRLLNKTYQNLSHIDFDKYNKALYTTTDMASQLNQGSYQFNNMKEVYGDYIIKLVFKGISNCWFCDYNEYRKFNNCTIDNWKEQQFKKFSISDKVLKNNLIGDEKYSTANHTVVSSCFEKTKALGKRVKGIQYEGRGDGNCLLIYDWSTAVPVAVSSNEGKTWEKVDKSKTSFSRSNFNKNDYIDLHRTLNLPGKISDYTLCGDYYLSNKIIPEKTWYEACKAKEKVKLPNGMVVVAHTLSKEDIETIPREKRKIDDDDRYWYWLSTPYEDDRAYFIIDTGGLCNSINTSYNDEDGGIRLGFKNPFLKKNKIFNY